MITENAARFREQAPHALLRIRDADRRIVAELESGNADVAIGTSCDLPGLIGSRFLFGDHWVAAAPRTLAADCQGWPDLEGLTQIGPDISRRQSSAAEAVSQSVLLERPELDVHFQSRESYHLNLHLPAEVRNAVPESPSPVLGWR